MAVLFIGILLLGRDMFLRRHSSFDCDDGARRTIDIRDFTTQYSAYSLELEASVQDKIKISTKLTPVQQQQLSEALQSANEFRKFVVAGYNSCAVTKAQYSQYGARFQTLDNLGREINQLTAKPSLSEEETKNMASLVSQYAELARKLGSQ